MFERRRFLALFMVVLCILLYLSRIDLQGNDISNQIPSFSYNPPPDSLIQELVVQVVDSNLTASIQRLQDFWTRDVHSDSIALSSYWIFDKLLEFSYTDVELDSFEADVGNDTLNLWNIVATKEGYGDSARVIIIGGHYDAFPCDSTLYSPGADDNASGVAGVLEVARILADVPLYDTLKFILFTGEEYSLLGSLHYVERAQLEGMDIELMINFDMIGYPSDSIKVHADTMFTPINREYAEQVVELGTKYSDLAPVRLPLGPTSDHWSFRSARFNAIMLTEWIFNPYWETCDDLLENLSVPYINETIKIALATLVTFAQHQSEPSGIGDQEPDGAEIPKTFALNQNYPNPFNPTTTISFSIPSTTLDEPYAKLSVYDLRGKLVKRLLAEIIEPGNHKVVWNGNNEKGQQVSSGIYLYTLKYGNSVYTRKMILVK